MELRRFGDDSNVGTRGLQLWQILIGMAWNRSLGNIG